VTAELDPERALALAYVPPAVRPALDALWRLDVTLGSVLATGSEPMISRIRLAWWREALERIDRDKPPAEPMLEAVARDLLPAGVRGEELGEMEAGWVVLTDASLSPEDLSAYAEARGSRLFRLSARLLGEDLAGVGEAGARWALVDLARRSGRDDEVRSAIAAASAQGRGRESWPRRLRPLGMLAVLAERDIARGRPEAQGSPGRIWRMLRHRLTGR
jgi:phytoene synthase